MWNMVKPCETDPTNRYKKRSMSGESSHAVGPAQPALWGAQPGNHETPGGLVPALAEQLSSLDG